MSHNKRQPNKLIEEKSPYLQQHAHNPVEWYPWSEEAFKKAEAEDKPIFLSIGYSTCHWCHVMAHESFEDPEVADLLNETFVNIKVDREERPDIDSVYMEVAQIITGRGGWPLTIIMTPDKKPFVAATYIPKEDRYGQRGMLSFIPLINDIWKNQREKVVDILNQIHDSLIKSNQQIEGIELDDTISLQAFSEFSKRFDEEYGGFNIKPKFPSPHNLLFLLRYWKRTEDNWALHMAEKTITEMRKGGIFDQIGFGFHRYSTDQEWILPHFEKMLYDQAMIMMVLAELYQITKNEDYAKIIREIQHYLESHIIDETGGFYSAEDADSEGVEGKYYVWSYSEIRDILDEEDAKLFIDIFNIKDDGNFQDEATGQKTGENIPYIRDTMKRFSEERGIEESVLIKEIERIRRILLTHRDIRERPHLDDKILTDWNGLIISALAKAGRVLGDNTILGNAIRAAEFIVNTMYRNKILYHRYKDEEVTIAGFLDDYSFMIWGLLELYESTFQPKYLEIALELAETMIDQFMDDENGGFFFSGKLNEDLLVRKKNAYDGAIPSGNSVAMLVLTKLSRITGVSRYEEFAIDIIKTFSHAIERIPTGFSMMLTAFEYQLGKSYEVIIAGELSDTDTKNMIDNLRTVYQPNKIVLVRTEETKDILNQIAPYTKYYDVVNGKTAAHVCRNYNCKLPTTDPIKLLELIDE